MNPKKVIKTLSLISQVSRENMFMYPLRSDSLNKIEFIYYMYIHKQSYKLPLTSVVRRERGKEKKMKKSN